MIVANLPDVSMTVVSIKLWWSGIFAVACEWYADCCKEL